MSIVHVTRNGPTESGMYGLTKPEAGGAGMVEAIRNDVDLCEKLRPRSKFKQCHHQRVPSFLSIGLTRTTTKKLGQSGLLRRVNA